MARGSVAMTLVLVACWCLVVCVRGFGAGSGQCPSSRAATRPAAVAVSAGYGSWEEDDNIIGDAVVRKKQGKNFVEYKPRDDRDRLPYDVYIASPPRRKLGRFSLDPTTGCGDMIQHGVKSYVVRKVACHYRFEGGTFKMFRKEADATELLRAAAERIALRMTTPESPVYGSDDLLT